MALNGTVYVHTFLHHAICSFQSVDLFFFCQSLGYAQLFQVFWRAALLQLPYGCLGNAIRWAKSSRHRPTWAAMPRQAPLENAQNGLQQPQQVTFCSFPFPFIFLVSAELRTASFIFFREIATVFYRLLSFNNFFPISWIYDSKETKETKSERKICKQCKMIVFC